MGLWTAIILIVVVVNFGAVLRQYLDKSRSGDTTLIDEIERLKERINQLENQKQVSMEERLSNVEKIVAEEDYALNKEISKALKKGDEG